MTLEAIDRAAGYATCQMLGAAGGALVGTAVWTAGSGPAALIPLGLGALSYMAQNALCGPIDLGELPPPPEGREGCQKVSGTAVAMTTNNGQIFPAFPPGNINYSRGRTVIEIVRVEIYQQGVGGKWVSSPTFKDSQGEWTDTQYAWASEEVAREQKWSLDPNPGSTCQEYINDDIPSNPSVPDVTYVDEQTNCTFNVQFDGFYAETPNTVPGTVWSITEAIEGKAASTVVGGCAVNNIRIYKPSNGGPNIPIEPPGGGGGGGGGGGNNPDFPPEWLGPLQDIIFGAAGILLADFIGMLGEYREEANWTLNYPCAVDEEGNPIAKTKTYTTEGYDFVKEMYLRTNLLAEMINDQFNGRSPICKPNDKPDLEGEWRTISFRSESTSPYGKSRLRKRFRYRSLSGFGLGQVVDHWKDFTWTAGSVCVTHKGYSWGTPQVWAATADEGKRVIQHAAREAGFDAFEIGEWGISSSTSARYGVSGQMKVDTTGGYYWITARDGSNHRPIVAK